MITFWVIVGVLAILTIFCLIIFIAFLFDDAEEAIGPGFFFLVFGSILSAVLINTDYSSKEIKEIYPSQITLMHDDEEVILKYKDHRWSYNEHKKYVQVMDSNFHIVVYENRNIFGYLEPRSYELKTYEEGKHKKEKDTSIPIKL